LPLSGFKTGHQPGLQLRPSLKRHSGGGRNPERAINHIISWAPAHAGETKALFMKFGL